MRFVKALIAGGFLAGVGVLAAADDSFAWQKASPVPTDIEKDFITPETFLDEEHPPWREEMRKRFVPVVKDCKTRREAILTIAQKASEVCGTKYTTERRAANQSAMESMESGKASCTGLSILLAGAYRSVGIPARIAGVGEWGDRRGNHTWVEVWDDDGWHFVEYYPDKKGLDAGWILDPITKLDAKNPRSRVMAISPGGSDEFFLPWDPDNHSLKAVDRTADYLKIAAAQGVVKKDAKVATGTAVFEFHDTDGKRLAKDFKVMDGEREVFSGRTPGPLDDLNNAPRVELATGKAFQVVFTNATGGEQKQAVTVKSEEVTPVILSAKAKE